MIKRWLPIIFVVGLLVIAYVMGLHEHISLTNLIKQREYLGNLVSENLVTALAVYMLIYIVLVAISFPGGLALSITAGFLFGWVVAGFATVTAATIGAVIIFLIARSSFGEVFQSRAGPFINKMTEGFQRDAFQYLLTLRLMPVFPFWVVNIVPALLNMKLVPYAVGTFVGIIPGTFAFTYLGAGLDSVIAEQEKANPGCVDAGSCTIEPGALVTPDLLLALFALGVLSFLPFIVKKFRGRKTSSQSEVETAELAEKHD
ncbi:MAG: TVP38/TMEM64 family protein [Pseudomonadota bacterium]